MKSHHLLLLAATCMLSACARDTNTVNYDAEWQEQQKRIDAQFDDFDRQTKLVDELHTKVNAQNKRFDKILDKWEEQARRQDEILSKQEQQLGIKN